MEKLDEHRCRCDWYKVKEENQEIQRRLLGVIEA